MMNISPGQTDTSVHRRRIVDLEEELQDVAAPASRSARCSR